MSRASKLAFAHHSVGEVGRKEPCLLFSTTSVTATVGLPVSLQKVKLSASGRGSSPASLASKPSPIFVGSWI